MLKALLAFMPDGKDGLPSKPKKADFQAKVKDLLGGTGAPKFSEIRQQLTQKKPLATTPATPAPAPAS